jgi:hypothetical protein
MISAEIAVFNCGKRGLTGNALMVILCSELFEEGDGLGKRLNTLHGTVGHVNGRSSLAIDGL